MVPGNLKTEPQHRCECVDDYDDGDAVNQNGLQHVEYNFEGYDDLNVDDLMLKLGQAVARFLVSDVGMRSLTSWISLKLIGAKME